MAEIAHVLQDLGVPVLAVPGNHDVDPQCYGAVFGNKRSIDSRKEAWST